MDACIEAATNIIEEVLKENSASKKLSDDKYAVKQGSTFVVLHIIHSDKRTMIRITASVAKISELTLKLAKTLLEINHEARFGKFSYQSTTQMIYYSHAILATRELTKDVLVASLHDVALLADKFDNEIVDQFGGATMMTLVGKTLDSEII